MPNHFCSGAESGENKEKLTLNQDLVVREHYHFQVLTFSYLDTLSGELDIKERNEADVPCLCHRGPWLNRLSAEAWEGQSETSGRLSQLRTLRVSVIVAY